MSSCCPRGLSQQNGPARHQRRTGASDPWSSLQDTSPSSRSSASPTSRTVVAVVEQAREASGCLDFAIGADLVDPGRINIFERWESQAPSEAFRGSGPEREQSQAMLTASVEEYDVADDRTGSADA